MLDEIQNRQKRRPFERFVIYLRDGRKLSVPQPELVRVPHSVILRGRPATYCYYFDVKDDAAETIRAADILGVKSVKRSRPVRRRGRHRR